MSLTFVEVLVTESRERGVPMTECRPKLRICELLVLGLWPSAKRSGGLTAD